MMKVNSEETAQRSMVTGRWWRAGRGPAPHPGICTSTQRTRRIPGGGGCRGPSCSSGGGGGGGPEGGRPGRARKTETTLVKC